MVHTVGGVRCSSRAISEAVNPLYQVVAGCSSDQPVQPARLSPLQMEVITPPPKVDLTDYVPTPAGMYHRSCVTELAEGDRLDSRTGIVEHKDGTKLQETRCAYPAYRTHFAGRKSSGRQLLAPDDTNYVEAAEIAATGTQVFRSISAYWTVPASPPVSYTTGEVFYAFPALQNWADSAQDDSSTILQPVLQYAANTWKIESWICGPQSLGRCNHTVPITVSSGDAIYGAVTLSSCGSGECMSTIETDDQTIGSATYATGIDEDSFTLAIGGAMETHNGFSVCGDFPPVGTFLTSIAVTDNGGAVTPHWIKIGGDTTTPPCGLHVDTTSTTASLYSDVGPTVSVSGPMEATEYTLVTVTAHPSGGDSPYSYSWTVNGSSACSNATTCSAYLGASGTFTTFDVTVTDAATVTGSGGKLVNSCPGPGRAPPKGPPPPLCGP